ncbi:MAG TPA: nicotinamide riboside transporter PnuC [Panacibacter sp.]|nr:nicotinamide riboside transporter PnuC [Panacibacter sp.]HNP44011.1 nicotinamide riboside transporter PnuC [Panacibacter sp.]
MKEFFDVNNAFFSLLGYSMSYIEFTGVVFGLIAVWLSAKAHILSWPIGIVNVVLAAILYFQVQLYPDMFLQVFFFVTNIIGWWRWANPKPGEADKEKELKVSYMKKNQLLLAAVIAIAGTFLLGQFASNLHEWFSNIFSKPSAYPYVDSFITVMSVLTTFYMIEKKIESWVIWILVDVIATVLYYVKGVKFYSVEYFIFTIIAAYGLLHWIREYKSYAQQKA